MPVLLLIMVAIMEFGLAFHHRLSANQAARDGVRVAALAGTAADADCKVLESLAPFLTPVIDQVDEVQVFRVNKQGKQENGRTNKYYFTYGDPADCSRWGGSVKWPPAARDTVANTSNPVDIIGVRVIYDSSWVTGFPPFDGKYTVDETAISRMEPEAYE